MGLITKRFVPLLIALCTCPIKAAVFSESNYTTITTHYSYTTLIYYPLNFSSLPTGFSGTGVITQYYGATPFYYWYSLFSSDGVGGFSGLGGYLDLPQYSFTAMSGDLNGDDFTDLFVAASESPWEFSTYHVTSSGLGDPCSFIPGQQTSISGICDMDGDSPLDLYGASGGAVVAWCGTGFGQYILSEITDSVSVVDVCASDLDADGDFDIVYLNAEGDISVLLNQGGLVFADAGSYGPVSSLSQLALSDLTGDDSPDILAGDDTFISFINDGSANFIYSADFQPEKYPWYFTVDDFDMDNCSDLAVVSEGELYIFKGDGFGSFHLNPTLFTYSSPYFSISSSSLAIGDYDNDGDPDLCCVLIQDPHFDFNCYWNTSYSQGMEEGAQTYDGVSLSVSSNPFRDHVTFQPSHLQQQMYIDIVDLSGRFISSISHGSDGAFCWDGTERTGEPAAAGVYLANLVGEIGTASVKIIKLD